MAKVNQIISPSLRGLLSISVALVCLLQFYQVSSMECGPEVAISPRIMGGEEAHREQWPFIAALYLANQSKYFCGGTLVSNRHILTAAHCIQEKTGSPQLLPGDIEVRLGAYNLRACEEDVVLRNVTHIYIHDDWRVYDDRYDADVAILALSDDVTFSTHIQKISLPDDYVVVDPSDNMDITGTIVGWGLSKSTIHEDTPRQADISTYNNSYCFLTYGGVVADISSKSTFCAGSKEGSPSKGDSGGGFFVNNGSVSAPRWVQYGIISAIRSNATGHVSYSPVAIYTNVNSFKQWIKKNIEEDANDWIYSKIRCKFAWHDEGKRSECHDSSFHSTADNVKISEIEGSFTDGKTYSDVTTVVISHSSRTVYIPEMTALKNKLPNFNRLFITNSGLQHVERSKLRKLPQLRDLNFYGNELDTLNEDILYDLPNLETFAFVKNRVRILPDKLLERQLKLKELWAWDNQIETIPKDFFKNNMKLTHVWLATNLLKKIDVNFNQLVHLNVLDLRGNTCIDKQACSGCSASINEIQDTIARDCHGDGHSVVHSDWKYSKIRCTFVWTGDERRSECHDSSFHSTADNVKISEIEGSFTDGKTYSDVTTVVISHSSRTVYIPEMTALKNKLSNFNRLFITNSGLQHVERSKLQKLPQLRVLNFYGNELETLNEDILYDLPNLEIFAFVKNRVRILPDKLLERQLKLKELWAWDNQIETIPKDFFKNNIKLTHVWLATNLLKKIDVNFNQLVHLNVLDLRGNTCIDKQACSGCSASINEIQDTIARDCNGDKIR